MKRVFGWVGFAVLTPCIVIGMLAYFLCDAFVFGWKQAEEWLDDF